MVEDEITAGSIKTSKEEKVRLAEKSAEFNQKDQHFRKLFPMLCFDSDDDDSDLSNSESDNAEPAAPAPWTWTTIKQIDETNNTK